MGKGPLQYDLIWSKHAIKQTCHALQTVMTCRPGVRRLLRPELPCVSVGTPRKPNYLPMELTHVAKGQKLPRISEPQKKKMVNEATMPPAQHLSSVRSRLAASGIASEPRLQAFQMKVDSQPLEASHAAHMYKSQHLISC